MTDETREALARYSHDSAWSGWMKYLFSKGTINPDGSWTMPAAFVERWQRQMNTLYDDLPEHEKTSDRAEADKMLAIIEASRVPDALEPPRFVPFKRENVEAARQFDEQAKAYRAEAARAKAEK